MYNNYIEEDMVLLTSGTHLEIATIAVDRGLPGRLGLWSLVINAYIYNCLFIAALIHIEDRLDLVMSSVLLPRKEEN